MHPASVPNHCQGDVPAILQYHEITVVDLIGGSVDAARVLKLRAQGWSWPVIAKEVGAGWAPYTVPRRREMGSHS